LAKKLARLSPDTIDVYDNIETDDFSGAHFIDDSSGYSMELVRQTIRSGPRVNIIDKMRDHDNRFGVSNRQGAGPAGLIFDTTNDELVMISRTYWNKLFA
jgi:hypothetical protein